jgi:tRNA-specific 2-thiouridylase
MAGGSRTIVVAMSGGVDSSVAAALLAREPVMEVVGVTLLLSTSGTCSGDDAVAAARDAAEVLGIRHHVLDCRDAFEEQVLRRAWAEYARGRTPNPCVWCNPAIKFGALWEHAAGLGASFIASGHHACIERPASGPPALLRGLDRDKDQSYFLFALAPEQLAVTLLPVGTMTKAEVRDAARAAGLPNADRAESQDACLVGDEGFAETLRRRFGGASRPGDIVDTNGRVVGRHDGIHRFTVGQRRGLGVATGQRAYVTAIEADRHRVVIDHAPEALRSEGVEVRGVQWLVPPTGRGFEAEVQIRYRHSAAAGRVRLDVDRPGRVVVDFREPQRAVTPGQAAVFYRGRRVVGGGWIERPLRRAGAVV